MTSNFSFLTKNKLFNSFSNACLEAEKSIAVSPASAAIHSRRALELAVKWLYSFDSDLKVPYQDNLSSLIHDQTFRDIIESDLFPLIRYIIRLGNNAVHTNAPVTRNEAIVSLHNLHQFVSWIDYCYSADFKEIAFNEEVLPTGKEQAKTLEELKHLAEQLGAKDRKLRDTVTENEELRKQLKAIKRHNTQVHDYKIDEISEFKTRKQYIDVDLKEAGWTFGEDCIEEFELQGMPYGSGTGYADYVLFDDNALPLAVIEAKRASISPEEGKHQATLYADCLEKQYGQRPIIFYTNGFKTYIWDDMFYSDRSVSGFYSKEELQLCIDRRIHRVSLDNIKISDDISNRYYQKEAIKAVCETFSASGREALLVMATGSGKTRTAISIVDVLTRHQWIKNVLFLADRTALVRQAKGAFNTLLPSLSLCNLLDRKDNPDSRMVFSTYPTMMNAIDEAKSMEGKKLFTVGHFDLIIIDEAHRSIFNKYQAIFDYFDALLLGLTATPKDEIDKNTYTVFNMEDNVPTYAYELEEAVRDGYLVPYNTVEVAVKFLEQGIHYEDLSDEEKEEYEATFSDEEKLPEFISSDQLNKWLFNDDTIDKILTLVMEKGIKVEGGDKLGKTILFAKNHKHAVRIVERFNKLYPHYKGGFAQVIDHQTNYAQDLIDKFSDVTKMPQIAVSVDMLDTGIDVPEVVNLVFFKKVFSKSKFWQMIGRGTRLCQDLFGPGKDKENFLIFDFCSNFEFFRVSPRGREIKGTLGLTERIFNTRLELVQELQHLSYQEEKYQIYREKMVNELSGQIRALNKDNFMVKQKLWYVSKYSNDEEWENLTAVDASDIKGNLTHLILPDEDDEMAKRFDSLILTLELALVLGKSITKGKNEVIKTALVLSRIGTIPQVREKKEIIELVQKEYFWASVSLLDLENVREALRDLIKFIKRETKKIYYTDFTDEILGVSEHSTEYVSNELHDYKKKVNQYIRENENHLAIHKLKTNKVLIEEDFISLEKILWNEIGTKKDYEREFGDTPLTVLVREIVGLAQEAANEAFSEFLDDQNLDSRQIRFVKTIIDYVVKNGIMERKALQEEPFQSIGSIVEIFPLESVQKIISIIDDLNKNAFDTTFGA